MNDVGVSLGEPAANEPRHREHDRVQFGAFADGLAQPRLDVAANSHDIQIRPDRQKLRPPPRTARAHRRACGNSASAARPGSQRVARVLPGRHARQGEVLFHLRGQILGRVNRQVHLAGAEGVFQLAREQALAPDGRQGPRRAVAARGDRHELGLDARMGVADHLGDLARLGQRQLAATRRDAYRRRDAFLLVSAQWSISNVQVPMFNAQYPMFRAGRRIANEKCLMMNDKYQKLIHQYQRPMLTVPRGVSKHTCRYRTVEKPGDSNPRETNTACARFRDLKLENWNLNIPAHRAGRHSW